VAKQIASWNSQNQVWITANQNQLLEQWALWQEVWPKSGMTVNGSLYELAMPAHLIDESESLSSQLPTPKARDHQAEGYEAGLRRATPQVGTVVKALVDGDDRLLRTPRASDGVGGALGERIALERGNSVGIRDQIMDLVSDQGLPVSRVELNVMPTPTTRDWKDSQAPHERNGVVQTDTVARAIFNSGEVTQTNWGKFEPAIRRWEQLTRPAPAPTKPDGKDGNHRLSSAFTEWMMGLPLGWVTGHGLKRNDELKMCGNGVVPQQAELALRYLLQDVELEVATGK
jgi:DNA (cytosine-5)-methyltransferase 1